MWWEAVEDIRRLHSIDGACPDEELEDDDDGMTWENRGWDEVFRDKRRDYNYGQVHDSIREHGFKRPLTVIIDDEGNIDRFGDGHHRLAAAVELGYTRVPVMAFDDEWRAVSEDSGSWNGGDVPTIHQG